MFDAATLDALRITLEVALGATILVALPAIGTGFALARAQFFGKSVVETIVALPLVLPPTAIGYLLLALFARDGWLGPRAIGFDPGVLFTLRGAIIASAVVSFPLVARSARTAFELVDPRLEKMSQSLGASPWRTFLQVSLPLARRGLIGALALGFGRAIGEFGATVIVAGNIPGRTQTLALAIFNDIQVGDHDHALMLVGLTTVLAFVLLWSIERWLEPRPQKGIAKP
ncbi:MAG TPA: molybdate ABC transporter permease subunit [Planctomycetota bacterium]|nr:molybdate ABC transporter permease subunit [Planctomycetota bacterium]